MRNQYAKVSRNIKGRAVSRNHAKKRKMTISVLMQMIVEALAEEPTLIPYQVAKKIKRDSSSVKHSYDTLKGYRLFLKPFVEAFIEAEKKGAFEEKGVYISRRFGVGRPGLGIKWENGEKVPGDPRDVQIVQEIFAGLKAGTPPSQIAKQHHVSREGIYKIASNRDYVKLGIIDEATFNAVQSAPDRAPRMAFKKYGLQWINGCLEPDRDSRNIPKMFEMRKEGKYYREIGEEFGLTQFQVRSIIKDPNYAGYRWSKGKWKGGELVRVPWITPIISLETWQAVQGLNFRWKARKKQKKQFDQRLRKVEDLLPATAYQIQKATNFKPSTVGDYLRELKKQQRAVQLFNGLWYRKDPLTDAIKQTTEQKGWKSFMIRSGWNSRDKILKALMEQPATWLQLIQMTKLPRGRVSYWLKSLRKDGIVKRQKGRFGKFYVSKEVAEDLRRLYAMLEALGKQK